MSDNPLAPKAPKGSGSKPSRILSNRVITISAVLVVLLAAGTAWLLLAHFGSGSEADNASLEAIRTVGTIVLGAGGTIALLLAARRQQTAERDLEQKKSAQKHAEKDAAERRITELYLKAADQLGSEKAPVRLAALRALERLAQDNPSQRQTIVDVICAYLRMPYSPPTIHTNRPRQLGYRRPIRPGHPLPIRRPVVSSPTLDSIGSAQQEREVRLTVQRILTAHLRLASDRVSHTDIFWPGIDIDLTNATLIDFDLSRCQIRTVKFKNSFFTGPARFDRAEFAGKVWFNGAKFAGTVEFDHATFAEYVEFDDAEFAGDAAFSKTKFARWVWFSHAKFARSAKFDDAEFTTNAWFNDAEFAGHAKFSGATFGGASWFSDARFAGTASFMDTAFAGTARFTDAEFAGEAWFTDAKFGGDAQFSKTKFSEKARFGEAKFARDTRFNEVRFGETAWFGDAELGGVAEFSDAEFGGDAWFGKAKFAGEALFGKAKFAGHARFNEAEFAEDAGFDEAEFAGAAEFRSATFAGTAVFDKVAFTRPPVFGFVWVRLDADRTTHRLWPRGWTLSPEPPSTHPRAPGEWARLVPTVPDGSTSRSESDQLPPATAP